MIRSGKIRCNVVFMERIFLTEWVFYEETRQGRRAGEESTIFLVAIKGLSESSKTKIYDENVILFCPSLRRKLSIMGKMKREWESLLSSLINRNIARFDRFKLTVPPPFNPDNEGETRVSRFILLNAFPCKQKIRSNFSK